MYMLLLQWQLKNVQNANYLIIDNLEGFLTWTSK